MTYLEKWLQDNPYASQEDAQKIMMHGCPSLNVAMRCGVNLGTKCITCWNREIEPEEKKTEKPTCGNCLHHPTCKYVEQHASNLNDIARECINIDVDSIRCKFHKEK